MLPGIMGRMGSRLLWVLCAGVAVATLVAAPVSALPPRVEHHPYTLGLDVGSFCEVGVGGACLELQPTDRFVTIDIRDATGMRVDAWVDFNDRYGAVHRTAAVCGKARLPIPDFANHVDVILQTFTLGALGCLPTDGTAVATRGEVVATFERGAPRRFARGTYPELQDCAVQVPDQVAVGGVNDDGERVSPDMVVLLDGVTEDVGRKTIAEAQRSYDPLNIALNVRRYQKVSFVTNDFPYLVSQAKSLFGGAVPTGIDVVFTLTSKLPLSVYGADAAGGGADCIGGIRYANRSFVLSVVIPPVEAGPIGIYAYATARAAAHEIGHVLGAQHQMANCVEGATDLAADDVTPCTLMSETAELVSRNFGTIEAAVVRGHAVAYAVP